MSIYQEHGYTNRADTYGIDLTTVHSLAELLGESEDFDGLIVMLEDYELY